MLFQAACDGLISSSGLTCSFTGEQGNEGIDFIGDGGRKGSVVAAPPPRPPPPGHQTDESRAGVKSAMDDLNDSIRVAMGSPSRPPPPASVPQVAPSIVAGVPSVQSITQQTYFSQMYSSPVKFPSVPAGKFCEYDTVVECCVFLRSCGWQCIIFRVNVRERVIYEAPSNAFSGTVTSSAVNSTSSNTNKVLTGDLESSIASLAENLTINKSNTQTK